MLHFQNILYIYSDTVKNEIALGQAVLLAQAHKAKLTIAFPLSKNIIPDSLGFSKKDISNYIEEIEAQRDQIVSNCSSEITVVKKSLITDSYMDIVKLVGKNAHDLVVKPPEDEGLMGKLFGSNDMGYLRQCPCPVWIVSPNDQHKPIVIAAVDVKNDYPSNELKLRRQLNLDVLEAANTLASLNKASVHIVAVWSAESENTIRNLPFFKDDKVGINAYVNKAEAACHSSLNSLADEFMNLCRIRQNTMPAYELVMLKGHPRKELPEYAHSISAEAVVMGTVARVGIPGLIVGNTAESILYRLNQSVFAIKPDGFKSPILS